MLLLLLVVGDISRSVRATLTHAATGLHAIATADMITKGAVIWTCTLVISLFVDYSYAQKLNTHWGPQSMMYLKGKHGRRFVSEDDNSVLKQCLLGWYAVLRGIQKLQSLEFKKPSHILSSEKVLVQYLQER